MNRIIFGLEDLDPKSVFLVQDRDNPLSANGFLNINEVTDAQTSLLLRKSHVFPTNEMCILCLLWELFQKKSCVNLENLANSLSEIQELEGYGWEES